MATRHPWHDLLLREWVGLALEVANERNPDARIQPLQAALQRALQDVIRGRSGVPAAPSAPKPYRLPRLGFTVLQSGRAVPYVERPDVPEHGPHGDGWRWTVAGHEEAIATIADELQAVVMALAVDPAARRLRRCDGADCGRFFFARADHRRDHHFCSEDHRRAFDRAHRDPAEQAAYMRRYRRLQTERAKRRTGKGRKGR